MPFADNRKKIKIAQTSLLTTIFITFIFLMNYTNHSIGGSGLLLPFNNATWIGFAAIFFVACSAISILGRVKWSVVHTAYAGCLFLLLFPLLYSDGTFLKYEYNTILGVVAAFALMFIVSQFSDIKFTRAVLIILYMSTLVQSSWGLVQYYFIYEPNILFLVAEHARPVGTFSQINVFSTYINLGSLLSLYFFFNAKKQTKVLLVMTLIVLAMNAHLNVLAETKTGRVVSLIAIALYLVYVSFKHKTKYLPLCLIILSLLTSFMPQQWFDIRPEGTEGKKGTNAPVGIQSLGSRPVIYELGIELALQEPVTGHGIGQVRSEFAHYVGIQKSRFPGYGTIHQVGHIHNEPLQWILQLGFLSGLAFLVLFALWVWGLKVGCLNPCILFLGLPFVGHSLLEFPFHSSAPHLLVFAIILGLSIQKNTVKIKLPKNIARFMLPASAAICLQIVTFMLTSIASSNALTDYQRSGQKDIEILNRQTPTTLFSLYYDIEKFVWKLDQGFKTGQINQDDILNFIVWAEQVKGYFVMNRVYMRLAQAYIITQDIESANRILDEALLIFPHDQEVLERVTQMKAFIE